MIALAAIGTVVIVRWTVHAIRWWRENDGAPSMFTPQNRTARP